MVSETDAAVEDPSAVPDGVAKDVENDAAVAVVQQQIGQQEAASEKGTDGGKGPAEFAAVAGSRSTAGYSCCGGFGRGWAGVVMVVMLMRMAEFGVAVFFVGASDDGLFAGV